jgi:hypothetical protein
MKANTLLAFLSAAVAALLVWETAIVWINGPTPPPGH